MKTFKINNQKVVLNNKRLLRLNGKKIEYKDLSNFEIIGSAGDIDFFKLSDTEIMEYNNNGDFIHGESANYTTCSLEELEEFYQS